MKDVFALGNSWIIEIKSLLFIYSHTHLFVLFMGGFRALQFFTVPLFYYNATFNWGNLQCACIQIQSTYFIERILREPFIKTL